MARACCSSRVMRLSAADGSGSPEGWLWLLCRMCSKLLHRPISLKIKRIARLDPGVLKQLRESRVQASTNAL